MPAGVESGLQHTLRSLTETLARELDQPGHALLAWSDREWVLARAVVVLQGISQSLIGALTGRAPAAFVDFLVQQRAHIAARHGRIEALLERIDRAGQTAGLSITPLKGSALHALGIYSPGDRPMADIDLLVQPADSSLMKRLLGSLGYREHSTSWKECVFVPVMGHPAAPLGEHTDNDIKIELHHRSCERWPLRCTDVSRCIFPRQPRAGLNSYPSTAALMVHLLLHAAGAMAFKALRCVQLHDIALLSKRMSADDWAQVVGYAVDEERPWWAAPPLRMTTAYFPGCVPLHVLETLDGHCSWVLARVSHRRRLTDVSFSSLWVTAFPGIEWSRSPAEAIEYMLQRVRPDRAQVALRQVTADSQTWAAGSRWTVMPQSQRIRQWMFIRQIRPATLHAVRAAEASVVFTNPANP